MSGYNNIGDKKVYIKTFNTYQMNDDHTFIGLRNTKDIECIERVYTQPAIFFSAELSETEYSFLRLLYDFECSYGSKKEVDDEINRGGVSVHPYFPADKDLELSKDNLRIVPNDSHIKGVSYTTKIQEDFFKENKALAMSLLQKNTFINENNRLKSMLIDENAIVNLQRDYSNNTEGDISLYLDIFRKDGSSKIIYHCAEYALTKKGWVSVPLKNENGKTSDKRKYSETAQGCESIFIPYNEECYMFLSNTLVPVKIIEKIRQQISDYENHIIDELPLRVTKFPKMCEIEDFWKSDNEDKNKEIFFKYTQYTKENNEEKISLFIPDYFGYTNKLYNLLQKLLEVKQFYFGDGDESRKLLYLVMTACSAKKRNWDFIKKDSITKENKVKHSYECMVMNDYLLEKTVEKLSWWIAQPEYCNMLYDFNYDVNNEILKLHVDILKTITLFESSSKAMQTLYDNCKSDLINVIANYLSKQKDYSAKTPTEIKSIVSREINNNGLSQFNIKIEKLESYTDYDGKNFFTDVILTRAKATEDFSLNICSCLVPYVIKNIRKSADIDSKKLAGIINDILLFGTTEYAPKEIHKTYLLVKNKAKAADSLDTIYKEAESLKPITVLVASINMYLLIDKIRQNKSDTSEVISRIEDVYNLGITVTYIGLKNKKLLTFTLGDIIEHEEVFKGFAAVGGLFMFVHRITNAFICLQKGDDEAALFEFVQAGIAITTIIFICCNMAAGWMVLLFVISYALDKLIDYYTIDDVQKWIKCCKYGIEYNKVPNNTFKTLHDKYLVGYKKYQYDKIKEIWLGTSNEETLSSEGLQIAAYYKIINDFDFDWVLYKDKYTSQVIAVSFVIKALSFTQFSKLSLKINAEVQEKSKVYKWSYPLGETIMYDPAKKEDKKTLFYEFSNNNLFYFQNSEFGAGYTGIIVADSHLFRLKRRDIISKMSKNYKFSEQINFPKIEIDGGNGFNKINAKEIKDCYIEYFNRFHNSEPEIQKSFGIKIQEVKV